MANDSSREEIEEIPLAGGADDDEIHDVGLRRFKIAEDSEIEMRIAELDDKKFLVGQQWDEAIVAQRKEEQRPILTINRMPQQVRQVTNDQRQNRPSLKVNPVDDKADIETAKIIQGHIRHIEYNSNADYAYDTAFASAASVGRGFFRLVTDYCDPMSFDQEIFIKMIPNHFMVYLDPNSEQPDGSDANWGFVFSDMPIEDFRAEYPDAELSAPGQLEMAGEQRPGWATKTSVRVAEYFYKTFKKTEIYQLDDGSVVTKEKLKDAVAQGRKAVQKRTTTLPAIKWAKINAVEILSKKDWPGTFIPIIPVLGDRHDVDGKKIIEGIIRHAKDPQRMYNYMNSAIVETIALAPKAPYVGAEGQFEDHPEWDDANTKNYPKLEYKPVDLNGTMAPPPQRQVFEPPIQAMTMSMHQYAEDIKATTGIYDASLGSQSNEKSGIAIQRRNQQAQTSNFHFIDNLSRSMRHAGRQIIELIPIVYDVPRTIRILGEDGQPELVKINQIFEKAGQETLYNLNVGKYDCTVSTGPSYQTKRQEAAASMLDMTRSYPKLMDVAGDIMVTNMDWPGSQEVAERLKKTLPPGIADDKDQDQPQVPPQIQQQLQQQGELIKNLTDQLNHKTQQIESKTIELESKERIEMAKLAVQTEIELAKIDQKDAITLLGHEVAQLKARQVQLGGTEPFEQETEPQAGPEALPATANQQPPTGGPSPGQPMGG